MPIAVLILVLIAYGYVLAAYPEYRLPGLALGAVAVVLLAGYFWRTEPEGARTASRIPPDELVLDQLALEQTPRGATFSGRVRNTSERFRLREMTIALRLHDCPAPETPLPECPVIGEATAIARPDAPPGQIRAFSTHYVFSNLPAVTGLLRWEWVIEETRATG